MKFGKEIRLVKFRKNTVPVNTNTVAGIVKELQDPNKITQTFLVDEGQTEDGFVFSTLRFYLKFEEGGGENVSVNRNLHGR